MLVLVDNLYKSFGHQPVLENIHLKIQENEIVVLMGESGSGKTTLIRCLCDLETPDQGKIIINDHTLFDSDKKITSKHPSLIYRDIGMVFQNYHLFPHRTILQNICDAPIYQKIMSNQEAKQKACLLLKKLHLEGKENMYPYMLSGGQKQRVAIARACILEPKILCFDEPTSALDPISTQYLIEVIQELKERMSILIITHDIPFGKAIGTRLLYMKDL